MTAPTAIDIEAALQRTLLEQVTGLSIPHTPLTAQATAGAASITITSVVDGAGRSRIVEGSKLYFHDLLGEEMLVVNRATVSGVTTTLGFDFPTGITGLAFTHTNGTTVYSNLLDYAAWDVAAMLSRGDPCFFVTDVRAVSPQSGLSGLSFPTFYAHIQSHRPLTPPDGTAIDDELWKRRVEKATKTDLEAIRSVLLKNQSLITNDVPAVAVKFAALGKSDDLVRCDYLPVPVESNTWHYVGTMDCIICGVGSSMSASS